MAVALLLDVLTGGIFVLVYIYVYVILKLKLWIVFDVVYVMP